MSRPSPGPAPETSATFPSSRPTSALPTIRYLTDRQVRTSVPAAPAGPAPVPHGLEHLAQHPPEQPGHEQADPQARLHGEEHEAGGDLVVVLHDEQDREDDDGRRDDEADDQASVEALASVVTSEE